MMRVSSIVSLVAIAIFACRARVPRSEVKEDRPVMQKDVSMPTPKLEPFPNQDNLAADFCGNPLPPKLVEQAAVAGVSPKEPCKVCHADYNVKFDDLNPLDVFDWKKNAKIDAAGTLTIPVFENRDFRPVLCAVRSRLLHSWNPMPPANSLSKEILPTECRKLIVARLATLDSEFKMLCAGGVPVYFTDRSFKDMAKKGALYIDIRETSEWQKGHLAGALSIPLRKLEDIAKSDDKVKEEFAKPLRVNDSQPKYIYASDEKSVLQATSLLYDIGVYGLQAVGQPYEELAKALPTAPQ